MKKNKKKNWSRSDLNLLLDHSSLRDEDLQCLLKEDFYADSSLYNKVGKLSLITLGIGLFVLGVLFFFAYNWDSLSKSFKLGVPIVLIIGIVSLSLFTKWKLLYKKTLLLAASILVGVLFAVFGQVYQTGANSYDLFLAWILAISLWTLVSDFSWQWFLYVILSNTTLVLYYVQVYYWENVFLFGIFMVLMNLFFLLLAIIVDRKYDNVTVPSWYLIILEFILITLLCVGCIIRIFDDFNVNGKVNYYSLAFVILSCLLFGVGYLYGYRKRQLFLVAAIPFSIIIILAFFLGNFMFNSALGYLVIGLFAVLGSTLLITKLSNLQKEWSNGDK